MEFFVSILALVGSAVASWWLMGGISPTLASMFFLWVPLGVITAVYIANGLLPDDFFSLNKEKIRSITDKTPKVLRIAYLLARISVACLVGYGWAHVIRYGSI